MREKKIITSPQLFCMLLVSRIIVSVTFGPTLVGEKDFWDCVISCAISYLITFFMVMPVYFLYKIEPKLDIIDHVESLFGKIGHIITIVYAIYFMMVSAYTLSLFKCFIENVMNPPVSFLLLSISLICLACYGAYKGIEGIARASSIILFFMMISLIFLGFSLSKIVDHTNFKPFFYSGINSSINGIMFLISRSSCIPAMALLFPLAHGKLNRGIFFWNTIFYVLMAGSIILVIGALGDFSQTRLFPAYSAASIAKIGSLENLDVLYLGLWTAGIFIKLSLFINLSSECLRKTFGQKNSKIAIFLMGIVIIFSTYIVNISSLTEGIYNTNFLLIFTCLTSFIIPLMLLLFSSIKRRCLRA